MQWQQDVDAMTSMINDTGFMDDTPMVRDSASFTNTYVEPLNLLQTKRLRNL